MNPSPHSICHAWLDAVNRKDLEMLTGLYAEDAILLATFSPHMLRTAEQRRAYFRRLAGQPGLQVSLHENTVREQTCGHLAVASGIYCFRMEIDGEPFAFEARFSFVLDSAAAHPILHHHSSQIPRNLS